jgi:hypothetical protein
VSRISFSAGREWVGDGRRGNMTTVHGVLDDQKTAWLDGPDRLITRLVGGPASEDATRIVVDGRGMRGLVGGTVDEQTGRGSDG